MIRRPLTTFEKTFIKSRETVQLALQLSHPKYVPQVIENMKKSFIALHLRAEGDDLISTNNYEVVKMPNSVRNVYDASEYICDINKFCDFSRTLGTIGYTDDIVAVTGSHLCTDGMCLSQAAKNCMRTDLPPIPAFPKPVENIFAGFIDGASSKQAEDLLRKVSTIPRTRYLSKEAAAHLVNQYYTEEVPIEELVCYDKERKTLKGLSESLWLALALSTSTYGNTLDKFGCTNCINMRPFMNPKDIDASVGNCFTTTSIYADNVDLNQTVRQLGQQFRKNFENGKSNGQLKSSMQVLIQGFPHLSDHVLFSQLSNLGMIPQPKEVVDLHIHNRITSTGFEVLGCLINYGKNSFGKDIIVPRFEYPPSVVSELDFKRIFASTLFVLKDLPLDTSVGDACNQIRKIQESIKYI